MTSIKKYVDMFQCKNIISVWDKRLVRGIKNYRRLAKTTEYKGTRDADKNEKVFKHEDLTTELLWSVGVKNMYPGILEADDVIYWLSKNTPGKKVVVSVDQDMLQLIDLDTDVYSPIKDVIITSENFKDQTGVEIANFIKYKSLVGDKSDNIPGVPRVGKKTAVKILNEGVDKKLSTEHKEIFDRNIKLMDLSYGYTVHDHEIEKYEEQFNNISMNKPDKQKLKSILLHNAVYDISNNIDTWFKPFEKQENNVPNVVNLINSLNISK